MIDYSKFESFEKNIGLEFKNKKLLVNAFVHRSFLNENSKLGIPHNERLEFLGDAVLELVITDYLYKKYPNNSEGELTAYRSALVNAVTLSETAQEIKMNEYMLLSRGESKDVGKARQYILANAFEAVIGAIYLDQGYSGAEKFISSTLYDKIDEVVSKKLWQDPKSLVQEKAQEVYGVTPSYEVISESGPDHDKKFIIGIFFGKEKIAEGKGKSKQEAETASAKRAIEIKNWN
ncbi:MAG TPA: ribonuclease III [Candidatus Paceibacterota bacterium]|nr:ribonuclease III [Candidatus Paceibacterota bacterium]